MENFKTWYQKQKLDRESEVESEKNQDVNHEVKIDEENRSINQQ